MRCDEGVRKELTDKRVKSDHSFQRRKNSCLGRVENCIYIDNALCGSKNGFFFVDFEAQIHEEREGQLDIL